MRERLSNPTSLVWHLRWILGGVTCAFSLVLISTSLIRIIGWEPTELGYILLDTFALAISVFTLTRWFGGGALHGITIAYIWRLLGYLVEQTIFQKAIEQGIGTVLILLLISPIPVLTVGFITGAIGKRLRVRKKIYSKKSSYY